MSALAGLQPDLSTINAEPAESAENITRRYALAARAGQLERFLVFGSFVTAKEAPVDLDVVLVMAESFRLEEAPRETRVLFSHADADTRFGASVFWVRRGILPDSEMGGFLDFWQTRRDGGKRGIVEVIA